MAKISVELDRTIKTIYIGSEGENLARKIAFDIHPWVRDYGDGTVALLVQRFGDTMPYPAVVDFDKDEQSVTWAVTLVDTANVGSGYCELQYFVGDILAKSAKWKIYVEDALGEPGDRPEPYDYYIEELAKAGSEAKESADRAERAVSTAEALATSVEESATRAEVAEENATQSAEQASASASASETSAEAADAARQAIENMQVDAVTLEPGENATVSSETIDGAKKLTFGIPQGTIGATGAKGDKGDPFTIAKTYPSIEAMDADFDNPDIANGSFVVISSNVLDENNAKLYIKGETAYTFITDMSGTEGIKGDPGVAAGFGIPIATIDDAIGVPSVTVQASGDDTAKVFSFSFKNLKGEKGDQGLPGETGEKGDPGDSAKINGVNTLTIKQGENVSLSQEDSVLTISAIDTTYQTATTTISGLMSVSDKSKLDSVETDANHYVLPDATASEKGGVTVGENISVSSGRISIKSASMEQKGVVQLSSETDSTDDTKAATPAAVKAVADAQSASNAYLLELIRGIDAPLYWTTSGNPAVCDDGYADAPVKSLLVQLDPVQEGSGTPGKDNIRSIQSWEAVTITRKNLNLLPTPEEQTVSLRGCTATSDGAGTVVLQGTSTETGNVGPIRLPIPITLDANETYYLYFGNASGFLSTAYGLYLAGDLPGGSLGTYVNEFHKVLKITNRSGTVTGFNFYVNSGLEIEPTAFHPMLSKSGDLTEYQSCRVIRVSLDEFGAIYGGTLDITRGTLIVTHIGHAFDGTEEFNAWNSEEGFCIYLYRIGQRVRNDTGFACSHYPSSAVTRWRDLQDQECVPADPLWFGVRDLSYSTSEAYQAYLSAQSAAGTPVTFYATLETPITYPLTAQEMTTLLGRNLISADCGSVSVTYRVEPSLMSKGGDNS